VTEAVTPPLARGLTRRDLVLLAAALVAGAIAGVLDMVGARPVVTFAASTIAIAVLAAVVSRAVEQVGARLSPGATGVLQASLSNIPEFFVSVFALRAGLVTVVQSALIGSILANLLLVLGLAIFAGGVRNGTQSFSSRAPRMIATLLLLAIGALAIPTIATEIHAPASRHTDALDVACTVILLALFVASIPYFINSGKKPGTKPGDECGEMARNPESQDEWSLLLAIVVLTLAGAAAAFVSEWFVDALKPTVGALGLSEAFTGLVIVAIAGNAIENVVGIRLAWHDKPDYAMSVILSSSLQVAIGLVPILVLVSYVLGGAVLTLVVPPLLIVALALAALLVAFIVFDGESSWLEGAALMGLYGIVAAAFWWG
jgi:Ca2+:H+ antiporter